MKKYNLSDGNILKVKQDPDPSNPRHDDNMTKMVCFHRRYNLGDKHDFRHGDYTSWEEMKKDIAKKMDVAVILPLYLYDHSGITISTKPFSCPWDSMEIGFVYVTKAKAREEYSVKRLTKAVIEKVNNILLAEVETYDQYLTGDIYGFEVETPEGDHVNSCWGFYGSNPHTNGIKDHIEAEILDEI